MKSTAASTKIRTLYEYDNTGKIVFIKIISEDGSAILKRCFPAWGELTRMGIKEFLFSTTDITGDSQFIIETGNYTMNDANKNLVDRGKYVVVWQQRNGEWKLYRDIGNTSLPVSK